MVEVGPKTMIGLSLSTVAMLVMAGWIARGELDEYDARIAKAEEFKAAAEQIHLELNEQVAGLDRASMIREADAQILWNRRELRELDRIEAVEGRSQLLDHQRRQLLDEISDLQRRRECLVNGGHPDQC